MILPPFSYVFELLSAPVPDALGAASRTQRSLNTALVPIGFLVSVLVSYVIFVVIKGVKTKCD